jgi:hypothetical protein
VPGEGEELVQVEPQISRHTEPLQHGTQAHAQTILHLTQ